MQKETELLSIDLLPKMSSMNRTEPSQNVRQELNLFAPVEQLEAD